MEKLKNTLITASLLSVLFFGSRGSEWEFSPKTRQRAIEKAGLQDVDDVEVHHRISVKVAKEHGLSPSLISSLWNAIAMRAEDHKELHRNGGGMGEEYVEEAKALQPGLFRI